MQVQYTDERKRYLFQLIFSSKNYVCLSTDSSNLCCGATLRCSMRLRYCLFGFILFDNVFRLRTFDSIRGEDGEEEMDVVCDNPYIARLHASKGPCQVCFFPLSEKEKELFEKNGRHLCVNVTHGGWSSLHKQTKILCKFVASASSIRTNKPLGTRKPLVDT